MQIAHSNHETIRVLVHGLGDAELVADTRSVIVDTLASRVPITDAWLVALTPSAQPGHWDLRVENRAGPRLFSFRASPSLVPQFVQHLLTRHFAR